METPPAEQTKEPPRQGGSGPLRLCLTCGMIIALVVGAIFAWLYLAYTRAFDPERAKLALAATLDVAPPPGYQAAFTGDTLGMNVVLIGPEGVDLRTPTGGALRMMFGVMPVAPGVKGADAQSGFVDWLKANPRLELRSEQTRPVTVVVRGQPLEAVEVLGTVLHGTARAPIRLVTVVVPKKAADPQGAQVLVGAIGARDTFDQAAWEAFAAGVR